MPMYRIVSMPRGRTLRIQEFDTKEDLLKHYKQSGTLTHTNPDLDQQPMLENMVSGFIQYENGQAVIRYEDKEFHRLMNGSHAI